LLTEKETAMYENVVIGINGLSGDRDAVALAKALVAENGRLTLMNVHVTEMLPSKGLNGAYGAAEAAHSRELLESQREAYAKEADVVSIVAVSVGAGLHSAAENSGADLLVVGACHRGPVGRVLAGDDARAAIHRATCAVAVAPTGYGEREAQIRTIGVAYDGSAQSEVALAHSALLATDLGAKLHAREVVEVYVSGGVGWASAGAMVEDPDALEAAAREQVGTISGAESSRGLP
jgi:nucleotide-binding universal stress UspA family protein